MASKDTNAKSASYHSDDIERPSHAEMPRSLTLRSAAGLLGLSLIAASVLALAASASSSSSSRAPQTVFTAPAQFPAKAYERYYESPSPDHAHEPRPIFTNVIDDETYPATLDDPLHLPVAPPDTDAIYPLKASKTGPSLNDTLDNITAIVSDSTRSNCTRCIDALRVGQALVRANPRAGPPAMLALCKRYRFASTKNGLSSDEACERMYGPSTLGAQNTQILSYANLSSASQDGQAICANILSYCPTPPATELSDSFLDDWFRSVGGRNPPAAPKEDDHRVVKSRINPSSRPLKVLHLSDIHLDMRYLVSGEGKCTSGQCCRQDSFNSTLAQTPAPTGAVLNASSLVQPANYWGEYQCDAPIALLVAGLQAVTPLNGGRDVDMTLYTGDAVTHDAANHISQDFVTMTEQAVFDTMRKFLGKGPVFAALGNHDSSPSDSAAAKNLPKGHNTFSWNYDYVSKLWESEGWFDHEDAKQIGLHYGGFSTSPRKGLRVISLNTNLWYRRNPWNNLRYGHPDPSGTLRFLTDELYAAEKRGEAVYIQGHIYSGWSGSDPGDAPTNLFGIIVERFQHTIREMFWGHSHEDFFNLFYRNNGTSLNSSDAFAHAYIGPSITPLTRVNPSFGVYDVDPDTYRVLDHTVYYSQLSTFESLAKQGHGPVFRRLYSAREAYSNHTASHGSVWPADAPLNATFWARTTDEMLARPELVQQFTVYQGRNSSLSPPCVADECVKAKVCYMRSGTALQGQRCPRGFSSVQGSG